MFEFIRGEKEVYMGFGTQAYLNAKNVLDSANIKYRTKIRSTGSRNRRAGLYGSYGKQPDFSIQYQIFVAKQDFESAQLLLRRHRT